VPAGSVLLAAGAVTVDFACFAIVVDLDDWYSKVGKEHLNKTPSIVVVPLHKHLPSLSATFYPLRRMKTGEL
jgi:hypothetical protein